MVEAQNNDVLQAHTLVVGGGISGITAAIETAEFGREVILLEKNPYIGGRVAQMNQYFPKLCPPSCGLEINFKRIKNSKNVKLFTLATVESISGSGGNYQVQVKLTPRYVNSDCTVCGDCEKACTIEVDNEFDFGLSKRKAIYMPGDMAFPHLYVVDPNFAQDPAMKACVEACKYNAIDLDMKPVVFTAKVKSIIWATGWNPYDAAKIENLGFGKVPNVITNVMMERLASVDGPTGGKIVKPSDGGEISSIAFVQCAGSRDENHLPYCSGICCLASMKQATYVRERYPEAEIHIFYIDVRSPGRFEDFYVKVDEDPKTFFHRGKAAEITEVADSGKVKVVAEDTMAGDINQIEVDMAVLATGMVPNSAGDNNLREVELDDNGFIIAKEGQKVIGAGTVVRPTDVASCVQDATGAAIKALQM